MGSGEAIGRRGFTLLELIVTLFVVALVTAIAVPTIGRSTEAVRVRADVAAFSAMLRHARERAITSRKAHAVVVDPGAHRMSIVAGAADGEVRESRALPERLEITADAAAGPHGPLRSPGGLERRRFPARHRDHRLPRHGRRPHRARAERAPVSRQGGFTLLEVLVAFAILSITVVVAVQGFAQGLRLLKLSGDHQSAILIADQRAREVVMPKEGHENGTDGGYTWERTIKELPAPELDVPGRAAQLARVPDRRAGGVGRRRAVGGRHHAAHGVGRRPEGGRAPMIVARDRRGFTLVELLIALSIVGALLAIAFGGLNVAIKAWRQGEDRAEAHQHVRSIALILARAVSATHPYRASRGEGPDPVVLFAGTDKRVEFVTQAVPFPGADADRLHRRRLRAGRQRRARSGHPPAGAAQPRAVLEGRDRLPRSQRHDAQVRIPRRGGVARQLGRRGDEDDAARGEGHGRRPPQRPDRGAATHHGLAPDGGAPVTGTRREEGGFALIAVLLVLAFVAVIGAEFAYSMRLEASAARIYKETLIATHLAEAGIEQATRELVADFAYVSLGDDKDPGNDPDCPLVFYTAARVALKRLPHRNVPLGGGQFTYCITDEEGRFNLNTMLTGDRFVRLLEAHGASSGPTGTRSRTVCSDWKDPNEEHRINGAESEDTYLKLPVPYRSKNGNLDSVAELVQIKGITPAVMEGVDGRRGLADVVSVWGSSQINVNTAGSRSPPGPWTVRCPVLATSSRPGAWTPTFPTARLATTGVALSHNSRTFRIEALGLVDGQVRARLTAIVRKGTNTGTDGITVLGWSGVR